MVPPPGVSVPDGDAILELERRSRSQGSGLTAPQLEGAWLLSRLWSRQQARPLAAAALLRPLAATLELHPGSDGALAVTNSVQLGRLQLRFDGAGELRGRRPLLLFWFERLQLRWGERLLLQKALQRPEPRALPFFALIATGQQGDGAWLVARGRGGGLALWQKAPLSRSSAAAPH